MEGYRRSPKRGLQADNDFYVPKKRHMRRYCALRSINLVPQSHMAIPQKLDLDKVKHKYPLIDPTLPTELTNQFQPRYCKLCHWQHNNPAAAENHYNSRNHHKKIRMFLMECAEKSSSALHPLGIGDNLYCGACNLPLMGKLQAELHCFSETHKRHKCFENLYCHLCGISVTAPQQMFLHIHGSKHKKKLKLRGNTNTTPSGNSIPVIINYNMELSKFRKRAGFYSHWCNMTLNSSLQFKQHTGSRGQQRKSA